jgi:DnaJ-class molecular chaperone
MYLSNPSDDWEVCPVCGGSGVLPELLPGGMELDQMCWECDGEGEVYEEDDYE